MPILSTRGLGLDIGGATIVADVSLEVAEGEFLGIIGPNGAGKTSLFNLLTGLYKPTRGQVELDGRDITHHAPYRRTQAGLGGPSRSRASFRGSRRSRTCGLPRRPARAARCGSG